MKRYCSDCHRLVPKDRWDRFRIDHGRTWLKVIILSSIVLALGIGIYGIFNHHVELVKYRVLNEDTGQYQYRYSEQHILNWGDGNVFGISLIMFGFVIPFGIFMVSVIKDVW